MPIASTVASRLLTAFVALLVSGLLDARVAEAQARTGSTEVAGSERTARVAKKKARKKRAKKKAAKKAMAKKAMAKKAMAKKATARKAKARKAKARRAKARATAKAKKDRRARTGVRLSAASATGAGLGALYASSSLWSATETRRTDRIEAIEPPIAPSRGSLQPARTSSDWRSAEFIAEQKDGTRLFRREMNAARRRGQVVIDGRADEAAWRAARSARFEWQERPIEGGKATGPTEFRVLYDDEALYVAVHAIDPEPERIAGVLHHPLGTTKIPRSDWVIVHVDPTRNRLMGYTFGVNPAGVMSAVRAFEGRPPDDTYAPIWEAATGRAGDGWWAEFRIPFSQMRMKDGYQDRWGLQIQRKFSRTQERNYWSPFTERSATRVRGYGNLVIDDVVDAGRPIELVPYVAGGARLETVDDADRLNDSLGPAYRAGADLRYQVASSLQLTASINPDFGQIEADPSEVNLTDQETFFSERRPLFVEDAELFQFGLGRGNDSLFYSRRIGARPHLSQARMAAYVDEDDATTIYGAAKLSGELGAGFNIGLLSALAAEESSRAQLDTGEVSESVIEPLTTYNTAQVSNTFRGGDSDLRLALTGVHRFLEDTGIDTLHRDAVTGGAQYTHRFLDNRWELHGMVAGSYVSGDPAALLLTQRASPRYFQRPDADHLTLDPERTDLAGYAFKSTLRRSIGSVHTTAGLDARSPGFETNDIGFLVDADLLNPWLTVRYDDQAVGGELLKATTASIRGETVADTAPEVLRHIATADGSLTFASDWTVSGSASVSRHLLDTRLLRGGPAVVGGTQATGSIAVDSDVKRELRIGASGQGWAEPESDSWRLTAGINLGWDILSNLELNLSPSYVRNVDDTQFVGAVDDAMGETRYILGRIEQSTLVATTRLEYTLSPRMSLQIYGEPFISAGRFVRFQEAADVRAGDYDDRFAEFDRDRVTDDMGQIAIDRDGDGGADLSFPRPDFQVGTLISNLVYRWEYLPGSHLYVIWSQSRRGAEQDGRIDGGDLGDVFTSDSAHVLLVKLSYWWSL